MVSIRLVLAVAMFVLASCGAASAQTQCNGQFPPGYLCGNNSTSPAPPKAIPFSGANLLTNNIWIGNQYFSGRPFCDPVAKGAVPDGVSNSLAAFNACLTALGAGGGTIWLDYIPGTGGLYCLKAASQAGIFNINVPVRLVFASADVSISSCGSGFSTLEISSTVVVDGAQGDILGPGMDGASAFGANYPTLIMSSGSGGSKLNNAAIYGGSPTIQWNCGECQASNVNAGFAYAVSGTTPVIWLFQNGGGELWNVAADQNEYPYGIPSVPFTISAWATSQSVATHAVRSATCQDGNSYVIQALSGGTTASSGTGPTCAGYLSTFTDGTVTWKLGYPAAEIKWDFDTGATDVHIHRADTGGAYVGLGFTNSLSGSGPSAITCIDCNGGDSYHAAVDAKAGGSDINFVSPNFAQCNQTSCALLTFESTFTGGVTFTGGEAIGSPVGVNIAGGSSYQFAGVNLSGNTTGIAISGASSKIAAIGNNLNGSTTGINISGTASDINFIGNIGCVSGSTTCVTNTSSGANVVTSPNDDGSAFAINVGATKFLNGSPGCVMYQQSSGAGCTSNLIADSGGDLVSNAFIEATAALEAFISTPIPSGGVTGQCIDIFSTANFGFCGGTGTPTLSAAKGSLYIDNSGGVPYYNNNGSTGWTQIGANSANPSATAGPTAINGSASTYMRSDAAPAIQKGSASQFGLMECDNVTVTCPGGVLTSVGSAATSVAVGTTTVASGTSQYLLYDNGTLGDVATTCSTLSSCNIASCYSSLSATNTALTSGGVVTLCPGSYSGTVTMPPNTAAWLFAYGATVSSSSSACATEINTGRSSGVGGGIFGLTCTGTGTYGIENNYANAGWTLKDLFINGYTYGVYYKNSWYTYNDNLVMVAPSGAGVFLDVCTDANCQGTGYFHHVTVICSMESGTGLFAYCPSGTMGNGIKISSDGGSIWTDIEIWGSTGPGFFVYPPSGAAVGSQWLTNVVADTAANASGGCVSSTTCGDGIRFDSTNGGTISGGFCTTCWGAFNANTGFVASGNSSSYVYNIQINGGQFTLNGASGINFNGLFTGKIEGSTIANNSYNAGSSPANAPPQGTCDTAAGIALGATQITRDVTIAGNFIGNFGGANCPHGSGSPVLAQKDSIDGVQSSSNLDDSIIGMNNLHNVGSGGTEINFSATPTNLQANNL